MQRYDHEWIERGRRLHRLADEEEKDAMVARIRELEAERDEAYARGVRDGIERVRKSPLVEDMRHDEEAVGFHCDAALAAFEQEQSDG